MDKVTEANELFDAVLTGTVDEDKKVSSKPVSTKKAFGEEEDITDKTAQNEGKRARNLSIYVGNFPWVSRILSAFKLIELIKREHLLFCLKG